MILFSPILPNAPQRIVSLVPSQTELLFSAGLNDFVVGITKFCVHPAAWKATKTIIGGTKKINLQKVKDCNPDLIIANKEENIKEQVAALAEDYPVWVTDVTDLRSALQMITDIGLLTHTEKKMTAITKQIIQQFDCLSTQRQIRSGYLIWRNPYMTVGRDTFIHDMMQRCGFINCCGDQLRYPTIDVSFLQQQRCELLLLSSEPYPFKQQHLDELQTLLPNTRIMLVDGELFSWYGSRLLNAAAYFQSLMDQLQ